MLLFVSCVVLLFISDAHIFSAGITVYVYNMYKSCVKKSYSQLKQATVVTTMVTVLWRLHVCMQ